MRHASLDISRGFPDGPKHARKKKAQGIMPMEDLKYKSYGIVMQEVPDEISLVINVSGCPHRCKGCHSEYLWDDGGSSIKEDLPFLLDKYDGMITCVCFMGGDHVIDALESLCTAVKSRGLKRCVYSGRPVNEANRGLFEGMKLEFYKLGEYREELGGLASPTTNQRFYKREGDGYVDITEQFHKHGNHFEPR